MDQMRKMLVPLVCVAVVSLSGCSDATVSGEVVFDGALEGMTGTRPAAINTTWRNEVGDFWVRRGNVALTSFQYVAESYDSVILAALAAEAAGTDGSALADEIVELTREGTKCVDFVECRALIVAGKDVDYEGKSGHVTMNSAGEVVETNFSVVQFGGDNRIDTSRTVYDEIVGVHREGEARSASRTRTGDGVLTIGSILPLTGQLAQYGPPQFAGIEYAIFRVNEAGGVLGREVRYVEGDSGDSSSGVAQSTVDNMIASGVDVAIGPSSTTVTSEVIDRILGAQIVQISPANTNMSLVDYADDGLYFRIAPADDLQGFLLSKVMEESGSERVYVAAIDHPYGAAVAERLRLLLEDRGIEVVDVESYDSGTGDFVPMVDRMEESKADSIVVIGFEESARLLRTMVRGGIGPKSRRVFGVDSNMGDVIGEAFDLASD